jgi:hypothetical protein
MSYFVVNFFLNHEVTQSFTKFFMSYFVKLCVTLWLIFSCGTLWLIFFMCDFVVKPFLRMFDGNRGLRFDSYV